MNLNKNISDSVLVEKLRKGDIDAFDALFEKYGNRLFGFALKYLKSKEYAEELVQDVILKVWRNRKMMKKDSSLKSYLFTISYHDICKFFRKKQLQCKLNEKIGLSTYVSRDSEEQIEYQSTLDQIEQVIEKLPQKHTFKIRWSFYDTFNPNDNRLSTLQASIYDADGNFIDMRDPVYRTKSDVYNKSLCLTYASSGTGSFFETFKGKCIIQPGKTLYNEKNL